MLLTVDHVARERPVGALIIGLVVDDGVGH